MPRAWVQAYARAEFEKNSQVNPRNLLVGGAGMHEDTEARMNYGHQGREEEKAGSHEAVHLMCPSSTFAHGN